MIKRFVWNSCCHCWGTILNAASITSLSICPSPSRGNLDQSMLQTVLAFPSPCPNLSLRSPLTKVTFPKPPSSSFLTMISPTRKLIYFNSTPSSSLPWLALSQLPPSPTGDAFPALAPIPQLKASESEKRQGNLRNVLGLREREFFPLIEEFRRLHIPFEEDFKLCFITKRGKMSLDS